MAKASFNFQNTILDYLKEEALRDLSFKKKFENPKKKIEDCVTYIMNYVQKSGESGFTDNEIYGMALHYYDEEEIDIGKPINVKVVVNHKVELTPEEIEAERQKAKDKIHAEVRASMTKKPKKVFKIDSVEPKGLF